MEPLIVLFTSGEDRLGNVLTLEEKLSISNDFVVPSNSNFPCYLPNNDRPKLIAVCDDCSDEKIVQMTDYILQKNYERIFIIRHSEKELAVRLGRELEDNDIKINYFEGIHENNRMNREPYKQFLSMFFGCQESKKTQYDEALRKLLKWCYSQKREQDLKLLNTHFLTPQYLVKYADSVEEIPPFVQTEEARKCYKKLVAKAKEYQDYPDTTGTGEYYSVLEEFSGIVMDNSI